MIDKKRVAPRLAEMLTEQNLTTKELGDIVSLNKATISRYINGKMAPKTTFIEIVAEKFGYNPLWLMGADTEKYARPENPKSNTRNEKDIQKILKMILEDMDHSPSVILYNGGEYMDEETKALIKTSIENALQIARLKTKKFPGQI